MPSFCLQILQKLQDLRLDGDVEGGGRLVGDQEIGLVGERHRDHHALTLAAGKLVRVGAEPLARVRASRTSFSKLECTLARVAPASCLDAG